MFFGGSQNLCNIFCWEDYPFHILLDIFTLPLKLVIEDDLFYSLRPCTCKNIYKQKRDLDS